MNSAFDPIEQKEKRINDLLNSYPGPTRAMMAPLAVALYVDWLDRLKVQKIGDLYLCSYYDTLEDWEIWISTYDPRKSKIAIGGKFSGTMKGPDISMPRGSRIVGYI